MMPSYALVIARDNKFAYLAPPTLDGACAALKLGPMGRDLSWPSTHGYAAEVPNHAGLQLAYLDEGNPEATPLPALLAPSLGEQQAICEQLRPVAMRNEWNSELRLAFAAHLTNYAAQCLWNQQVLELVEAINESVEIFVEVGQGSSALVAQAWKGLAAAEYNLALAGLLIGEADIARNSHELAFSALAEVPGHARDMGYEFIDSAASRLGTRIEHAFMKSA
ncbi:hypothetical protein [Agromyces larvae]|uniref:DUF4192 family protein n=1 Tax=Agromyces larvae TaxID=2929802 RepID=A0ABY4BYY9_9MICO|nr:hypothetical protein [Agromyces larvae]UOE43412.1 hypothetical protein MTO99_14660 [Agromyces larvae]